MSSCFRLTHFQESSAMMKSVKDGVIPEDFVFVSSGFLPQCEGIITPQTFRKHGVVDNRSYPRMLYEMMECVDCGGISVL